MSTSRATSRNRSRSSNRRENRSGRADPARSRRRRSAKAVPQPGCLARSAASGPRLSCAPAWRHACRNLPGLRGPHHSPAPFPDDGGDLQASASRRIICPIFERRISGGDPQNDAFRPPASAPSVPVSSALRHVANRQSRPRRCDQFSHARCRWRQRRIGKPVRPEKGQSRRCPRNGRGERPRQGPLGGGAREGVATGVKKTAPQARKPALHETSSRGGRQCGDSGAGPSPAQPVPHAACRQSNQSHAGRHGLTRRTADAEPVRDPFPPAGTPPRLCP